jgi:putative DNA primase/helicase
MNAVDQFLDAMCERGLEPVDEIVADGVLHRVRWHADRKGARNGAYVLHVNGHRPAGWFQCFKRGIQVKWAADGARLTAAERKAFAPKMAEERKRRQKEERERQELVAKQAQAILETAQDADPAHPYLQRKGVGPHDLKVDATGRLLVPLRDLRGKVWSVQTIAPDGTKRFLPGGRKQGLYWRLGTKGRALVIAEGFATAASIREATGLPVIIAFDCGNLLPVAKTLRQKLPLLPIVIAADDDHATEGNPGLTKAREAAELIGAAIAVPTFPDGIDRGTDFNDLAALRGLEPVAEIIQAALAELVDLDADEGDDLEPEPPPGASAATAQTDDDWEQRLLDAVEELNAKHFVVTVGGQTLIATPVQDEALKREILVFSQERDIKLRYKHRHYRTGYTQRGCEIWQGLGEAWLEHAKRRTFDRIALIPKGDVRPGT